jgi:uncharacterized protein YcbK (DUF882 family)
VLAVASVSLLAALVLLLYYFFVTNVKKEDIDMYQFKYFSWDELTKSDKAREYNISNIPGEEEKRNLTALVMMVLDPLREKYGKPITVNSAYRSFHVNLIVGGAESSQHVKGQAADITAGSKEENKKLFNLLKDMDYDQLINEKDYTWIHVSYKRIGYNRKQILNL